MTNGLAKDKSMPSLVTMLGMGISLSMTNVLLEVVDAFPNLNTPLVIVFVPEPSAKPRSSDEVAELAFSKTMIPPEKLKSPFDEISREPVSLAPLPTVLRVTVPPDILIPDAIPGGSNVPPAVFSNLPEMSTVPPNTSKAPSTCVCTSFPEPVPKLTVPELILISPSLTMEKFPVVRLPPLTSSPPVSGISS